MKKPKEGVYISQTGKLKVFYADKNKHGNDVWCVDAWEFHPAPLLKALKVRAVHEMSVGWPVFEYQFGPLYKCEWVSEL